MEIKADHNSIETLPFFPHEYLRVKIIINIQVLNINHNKINKINDTGSDSIISLDLSCNFSNLISDNMLEQLVNLSDFSQLRIVTTILTILGQFFKQ